MTLENSQNDLSANLKFKIWQAPRRQSFMYSQT